MAVYIDVIWFLNFCIDLLLLLLTSFVLKRKVTKRRLVIAAVIASSSIFLVLTAYGPLFYHPIFKLCLSACIVVTAFSFKKFSYFIQNLATFYFVSFICGGGLVALHYFFNSEITVLNGVVTTKSTGLGTPISWLFIVVVFPVIWFFSKRRFEQIEVRKLKYEDIVNVDLYIFDQHIQLRGLIDSGNQLSDPITKRPVMVIDMNDLQNKFPKTIVEQAKHPEMIGDPKFPIEEQWQHKLCIIPYRGVGQVSQFIIGLKPNKVDITLSDGKKITCTHVVVGLNWTNLSSEGDFNCILHPHMLLQGKERLA